LNKVSAALRARYCARLDLVAQASMLSTADPGPIQAPVERFCASEIVQT
jgi:hypothetical protein